MRLLGYFGILALIPVNVFGFVSAFQQRDWKGIALMLFLAGLLTFSALTLRRGARAERGFSREKVAEGWGGESVTSFFANVVAKSPEGRIYIAGALACVVAVPVNIYFPELVAASPARASGNAVLFGIWPIVFFAWYVRTCGPGYKSSIVNVVLILAGALFPFYIAYVRSAA